MEDKAAHERRRDLLLVRTRSFDDFKSGRVKPVDVLRFGDRTVSEGGPSGFLRRAEFLLVQLVKTNNSRRYVPGRKVLDLGPE